MLCTSKIIRTHFHWVILLLLERIDNHSKLSIEKTTVETDNTSLMGIVERMNNSVIIPIPFFTAILHQLHVVKNTHGSNLLDFLEESVVGILQHFISVDDQRTILNLEVNLSSPLGENRTNINLLFENDVEVKSLRTKTSK